MISLRVYKISSWATVTEKGYIIDSWFGTFQPVRPLLSGGETSLHWSRLHMNWEQYLETNAGEEMCCLTKDWHQDTHKMDNKNEITSSVISGPWESIRGATFCFFHVFMSVLKFNIAQKLEAGYHITNSTHKYKSGPEKICTHQYAWRSGHFLPTEMIWQVLRSLY